MLLDRTVQPIQRQVDKINIKKVQTISVEGTEVPLHYVSAGQQPVIRFEIISASGSAYDQKKGLSTVALRMLSKGTSSSNASQLAERLNNYGAYFDSSSNIDSSIITLYCLKKHFKAALEVVGEMIFDSTYPDDQLSLVKTQLKQELKVNLEKGTYVASRKVRDILYNNHPYGNLLSVEAIDAISRDDIVTFFNNNFLNGVEYCLSGQVGEEELNHVKEKFSLYRAVNAYGIPKVGTLDTFDDRVNIKLTNATQSSIRLCKRIIEKRHDDFMGFFLANKIFGGYFGSRLMKNIREDKGLTYGISSSIAHLSASSFMVISTEANHESTDQVFKEIDKELERLRNEQVSSAELQTVRNYTLGKLLGGINTPFSLMDHFKNIHWNGLDYSYYDQYVARINEVTPLAIQEMAHKYLDPKAFVPIVAG